MIFESPDRQDLPLARVIRVYDLGIKIEQACQAATFVFDVGR